MNLKKYIKSEKIIQQNDFNKILTFFKFLKNHVDTYLLKRSDKGDMENKDDGSLNVLDYYQKAMLHMMKIVDDVAGFDLQARVEITDTLASLYSVILFVDILSQDDYVKFEDDIYFMLSAMYTVYDEVLERY